ncbi:YceI family protein [Ectothiorhodospiraceae bacterium WFHF3C12]|nr:YceI family protein [Ectothiorhodospiraceae bacterium WFHF3C12]
MIRHAIRLLTVAGLLLAAAPLAASQWQIEHGESRLGFTATQQGGEFTGRFDRFKAEMRFDPDDLAGSRFDVTVDVTSVNTGSSQRDRYLPDEEWFHTDDYPKATFVTTEFRHLEGERYEADGELTIKGNTRAITLPFTWTIDGDNATMDGEVTLDRTNYGVGTGDWSAGDTVGLEVTVHVELTLRRKEG